MSVLNVWNFVQLNGCFLIILRKRGLQLEQKSIMVIIKESLAKLFSLLNQCFETEVNIISTYTIVMYYSFCYTY